MSENPSDSMGRRSFLTRLSTTAAAVSSLYVGSQSTVAQTEGGADEIEYLAGVDREPGEDGSLDERPVYRTIDPVREARIQAVTAAEQRVRSRLAREFGEDAQLSVTTKVLGTDGYSAERGISVQLTTMDRGPGRRVEPDERPDDAGGVAEKDAPEVEAETVTPDVSREAVERALPGTVAGTAQVQDSQQEFDSIPVEVETRTVSQTRFLDSNYRPLPGGCEISQDAFGYRFYGGVQGTTCSRAMDRTGSDGMVMMTAGHVLDFNSGRGDNYQADLNDGQIGEPGRYSNKQYGRRLDAGYISTNGRTGVADTLATDSGGYTQKAVSGIRTYAWIKRQGPFTTLKKKGRTTGTTTGTVQYYNDYDEVFFVDAPSEKGDSGGPIYDELGDRNLLVGMNVYGIPDLGWGGGNSAERIEQELDVAFT